jgi:hypothetical protein
MTRPTDPAELAAKLTPMGILRIHEIVNSPGLVETSWDHKLARLHLVKRRQRRTYPTPLGHAVVTYLETHASEGK